MARIELRVSERLTGRNLLLTVESGDMGEVQYFVSRIENAYHVNSITDAEES